MNIEKKTNGAQIMQPKQIKYETEVTNGHLTNDVANTTGWAPFFTEGGVAVIGSPRPGIAQPGVDHIVGSGEATFCMIVIMIGSLNDERHAAVKHFQNTKVNNMARILATMEELFDKVDVCAALGGITDPNEDSDEEIQEQNAWNDALREEISMTLPDAEKLFMMNSTEFESKAIYAWTDTNSVYWDFV